MISSADPDLYGLSDAARRFVNFQYIRAQG